MDLPTDLAGVCHIVLTLSARGSVRLWRERALRVSDDIAVALSPLIRQIKPQASVPGLRWA
jgi:hypothetical protein